MSNPRIGIVDSGVHRTHPHVGNISGGITITAGGTEDDYTDVLGHGTAVASLIHHLAPQAELYAVRVFDKSLSTGIDRVLGAIDWCISQQIDIINLSLGTNNPAHRVAFETAVARVRAAGIVLVSAFSSGNNEPTLPGTLPGVIAVEADADCSRDGRSVTTRDMPYGDKYVFRAPPWPRDIPGVAREDNLHGVSFAVAHITSLIANQWPQRKRNMDWESLLATQAMPSATRS